MQNNKDFSNVSFIDDSGNVVNLTLAESFNKGSINWMKILVKSISQLGCARSVVADANNTIIVGEKVVKAAHKANVKKIRIIETEGDELIVVKRTDILAGTRNAYNISLVDNLSQSKNLIWDVDKILSTMDANLSFDAREWGGHECLVKELHIEDLLKDDVQRVVKSTKKEKCEIQEHETLSLFD